LPLTSTDPSGLLVQPGPEDTWAGTDFSVTPARTPEFVASGNPHLLGVAEQFVVGRVVAIAAAGATALATMAAVAAPATLAMAAATAFLARLRVVAVVVVAELAWVFLADMTFPAFH